MARKHSLWTVCNELIGNHVIVKVHEHEIDTTSDVVDGTPCRGRQALRPNANTVEPTSLDVAQVKSAFLFSLLMSKTSSSRAGAAQRRYRCWLLLISEKRFGRARDFLDVSGK